MKRSILFTLLLGTSYGAMRVESNIYKDWWTWSRQEQAPLYSKKEILSAVCKQGLEEGKLHPDLVKEIKALVNSGVKDSKSAHVYFGGFVTIDGVEYYVKIGDSSEEVEKLSALKEKEEFKSLESHLKSFGATVAMPEKMGIVQEGFCKTPIAYTITRKAGEFTIAEALTAQEHDGMPVTKELKKILLYEASKTFGILHEKMSHGDAHLNNLMGSINPKLKEHYEKSAATGMSSKRAMKKAIEALKKENKPIVSIGLIDIETMNPVSKANAYLPNVGKGKNEATDLFKFMEIFYSSKKEQKFGKLENDGTLENALWDGYLASASSERLSTIQDKIRNEGNLAWVGRWYDHSYDTKTLNQLYLEMVARISEELKKRDNVRKNRFERPVAPREKLHAPEKYGLTGSIYVASSKERFTPKEKEDKTFELREDHKKLSERLQKKETEEAFEILELPVEEEFEILELPVEEEFEILELPVEEEKSINVFSSKIAEQKQSNPSEGIMERFNRWFR